ncbi:MAG: radical SAM protein [Terriglobales bacterium]
MATGPVGLKVWEVLVAWGRILAGRAPMLSIEITKECPLRCPGCYAYNDNHLGGAVALRSLSELRGEALVNAVLDLVRKHRPAHVSLVGGEPLLRVRELNEILPRLSAMNVFSMVVTSAVAPIPAHWMQVPRFKVAVSVDGLPEHHDIRRRPATYERILKNIADRQVNIHLTITRPMLQSDGYLAEYFSFWNSRPEVARIWVSTYTPQKGEQSPEMLTRRDRSALFADMVNWRAAFPKVLINPDIIAAFEAPPPNPGACVFAKMSVNYSADMRTRVEPCIFGGEPDCATCGCASSIGLQSLRSVRLVGPLKAGHLLNSSIWIGSMVRALLGSHRPSRWRTPDPDLVQIATD